MQTPDPAGTRLCEFPANKNWAQLTEGSDRCKSDCPSATLHPILYSDSESQALAPKGGCFPTVMGPRFTHDPTKNTTRRAGVASVGRSPTFSDRRAGCPAAGPAGPRLEPAFSPIPTEHAPSLPASLSVQVSSSILKTACHRLVLGATEPGVDPRDVFSTQIQSEVSNNEGETQICHQKGVK